MSPESSGLDRQSGFTGPERVRCWLCGWPIVVRSSESDRIYLFCMECGMQVGIHSATGAKRLRDLVEREKNGFEPRGVIAG